MVDFLFQRLAVPKFKPKKSKIPNPKAEIEKVGFGKAVLILEYEFWNVLIINVLQNSKSKI